jgi:hypothetical protein
MHSMYQRAALETGTLNTGDAPVKKKLKERHCIYVHNRGKNREILLERNKPFYRETNSILNLGALR